MYCRESIIPELSQLLLYPVPFSVIATACMSFSVLLSRETLVIVHLT